MEPISDISATVLHPLHIASHNHGYLASEAWKVHSLSMIAEDNLGMYKEGRQALVIGNYKSSLFGQTLRN